MMPNTVLLKMTCLQKMVRIAIRKKIISHNPFAGYTRERPKTVQRYLPFEELEKMMAIHLKSSALAVTRDMFVFSCYTGLSYIDLYNLTFNEIENGDEGMQWINISRLKTDSICKIPLMEVPLQLIEKYRGTGSGERIFPMKGCCLMNRQLKRIATLCDIKRRLTFHMARHTFATEICLSRDIPLGTVARMMGHKNCSTTEIYAKTTLKKVSRDMEILSKKISGKYFLAS
jgi:integrase